MTHLSNAHYRTSPYPSAGDQRHRRNQAILACVAVFVTLDACFLECPEHKNARMLAVVQNWPEVLGHRVCCLELDHIEVLFIAFHIKQWKVTSCVASRKYSIYQIEQRDHSGNAGP